MEGFYDRASAVSMFLSGSVAVNNVAPIVRSPTVKLMPLDILNVHIHFFSSLLWSEKKVSE